MVNSFNSRNPRYNDDSDYTTNAPSYYDDLARKNKLVKELSLRIWEYDKTLSEGLENIENVLNEYVNIVDGKIEMIDFKIGEGFNDEINNLLVQWVNDGTLNHIINEEIFNTKVDTDVFNNSLNEVNTQLAQKASKADVANISSGTPLFASSVVEMTDTTRVYVNTSDGLLYLYNSASSVFETTGVKYQSTGIADKSVGMKETSYLMAEGVPSKNIFPGWEMGSYDFTTGVPITDNKIRTVELIPVNEGEYIWISDPESQSSVASNCQYIFEFDVDRNFLRYVPINVFKERGYLPKENCRYIGISSQRVGDGDFVLGDYKNYKTQIEYGNFFSGYVSPYPKTGTDSMLDNSVTTPKIQDGSVTSSKLDWRSKVLLNTKIITSPVSELNFASPTIEIKAGFKHWGIQLKPIDKTFNAIKFDIVARQTQMGDWVVCKVRDIINQTVITSGISKIQSTENGKVLVVLESDVHLKNGLIIEVYSKSEKGILQRVPVGQSTTSDPNIEKVKYSTSDVEDIPTLDTAAEEYSGFTYELYNLTGSDVFIEPYSATNTSAYSNLFIVDKNGQGDYDSIQGAVDNAQDSVDRPITLSIMPGIYEESVNILGGRNLSLVGINKKDCIIKTTTGLYEDTPLELSGNTYVENLSLVADYDEFPTELTGNKAYALHIDYAGEGVAEFNNCYFKSSLSSALGLGTKNNQTIKFRNCVFESDTDPSLEYAKYGAAFLHASTTTTDINQRVEFHNCIFRSTNEKIMRIADVNGSSEIVVAFYNCMLWSDINGKADSAVDLQGSKVIIANDSYGNNVAKLNK